jgi:abortive infection bacteriophage resistance protein
MRDLFRSPAEYESCLTSFREEFSRSRETFVEHYKNKYTDPELPPIWAACEIMSFGQLSKWFYNLKFRQDRKEIASVFDIDESVLGSFMHHLSHVRNLAAHHSRLWNRRLTFTMTLPNRPQHIVGWFNTQAKRNIYNTLAMLGYILRLMSPGTTWTERLRQLIEESPLVNSSAMGFPPDWRDFSLWRTSR